MKLRQAAICACMAYTIYAVCTGQLQAWADPPSGTSTSNNPSNWSPVTPTIGTNPHPSGVVGPVPTIPLGLLTAPQNPPGVVFDSSRHIPMGLALDPRGVLMVTLTSIQFPGKIVAFNTRGSKLWVKTFLPKPTFVHYHLPNIEIAGLGYHEWEVTIVPGTAVKADGNTVWFSPYRSMKAPEMTFPMTSPSSYIGASSGPPNDRRTITRSVPNWTIYTTPAVRAHIVGQVVVVDGPTTDIDWSTAMRSDDNPVDRGLMQYSKDNQLAPFPIGTIIVTKDAAVFVVVREDANPAGGWDVRMQRLVQPPHRVVGYTETVNQNTEGHPVVWHPDEAGIFADHTIQGS